MRKKLIIILIIGLIAITPTFAEKVTAKVDDKGVIAYGTTPVGTLHTQYGWITVKDTDYNKVKINDTITYDTEINSFWNRYWDIEVQNG